MAQDSRKVLMLCYYFPPLITSGVTRSLAFSQNLLASGWTPVVLTVKHSHDPWIKSGADVPARIRIERSAEWNLAQLVDLLHALHVRICRLLGRELKTNYCREYFCIPDTQLAWWSTAPGIALAKECDVLYVSCSPFSSAMSACLIKRFSGKPLVLDFRDAWSLNPHVRHPWLHRALVRFFERRVLNACDKLIVNTEGTAELYRENYPQHEKKIIAIPNGYDTLTPVTQRVNSRTFTILHVGTFYGSRSADLLLEVLSELQHLPIEFLQVGGSFPSYERFKNKVRMSVLEPVKREKALELMQQASLLYLKQGTEAGVKKHIAVAAKTYEYLATGLPILAEVPPGDNADVLTRYGSAAYVITSGDKYEIKKAVLDAYEKGESFTATIKPEFVRDFDRSYLTKRLAEVFDEVTKT